MPATKKGFILLVSSILGVLIVGVGLWAGSLQTSSIIGTPPKGEIELIDSFPWQFKERGDAKLTAVFNPTSFTPPVWQIIPDDHLKKITINGQTVDLSPYTQKQLKDYKQGFLLNISPYLKTGSNTAEFAFSNDPGPGGLKIYPKKSTLNWLIIYAGFLIFALSLAKAVRLTGIQIAGLCIGLIVIIIYWSETPWNLRSHDADGLTGHFGYVRYIAENLSLPNPTKGWTFYHPPLYYASGAIIWRLAEASRIPPDIALQAYAITLWLIFLVTSLAALKRLLPPRSWALTAASLALVLWPSGIIHSIRIGNDAAYYAISGLAFLYGLKWWRTGKTSQALIVAFLCMLSLLVKSNGIVLCACMGTAVSVRFLLKGSWKKKKKTFYQALMIAGFSITGIILSSSVRIYFYLQGEMKHWLVGNLGSLNGALKVPNEIKAYIPIDIPTFITQPFISTWVDETGRGNFWNFLLRSSLTGEFTFTSIPSAIIAVIWGIIILLLWFLAARSIILARSFCWLKTYKNALWILLFAYSIASLAALRFMAPYACSNDFRYILPMLVPLVGYWGSIGKASRGSLLAISALSIAFFFTV